MQNAKPVLTEFQLTAEQEINALLLRLGRRAESREVLSGVVPFFSNSPQTVLTLISGDFQVWLYDDEASFSAQAGGGAVERLDFRSEPDLLVKLLEKLQAALDK